MQVNSSRERVMAEAPKSSGSKGPTLSSDDASSVHSEVVPRAQRRRFSPADKKRILEAADRCSMPGEIGALMRREGVYSSSLSTWRRQRENAGLDALAPKKRGPKLDEARIEARQLAQMTRERDRLQERLDKALLVIDVQKKLAALLGTPIEDTEKP